MALNITTLSLTTSNIMTSIIMTYSIMTFRIMTTSINDTQHNDIQHNDTQHNDIQHNDTQHGVTKILNHFCVGHSNLIVGITNSQYFVFFLTYKWAQNATVLHYTRLKRLARGKHSSLLNLFVS